MKIPCFWAFAIVPALVCGAAPAQDWAPSRYGAADMAGASNLMTELNAIQAANIIRRGRVVELGREYRADMPLGPAQGFDLTRTRVANDNVTRIGTYLGADIAGAGTHLDGLGHVGTGGKNGRFYNGLSAAEIAPGDDPGKLGIEHVKPFFTRGIMIDMVTVRGGPMGAGDEITVADIETALDWFGLDEPGNGDAVIFHTGWGRHWIADNGAYLSGAPGIGMEAAAWLIEREVALVGADTWAVEVQAPGDGPRAFPVQLELTAKHGIFLHQNLETERLIDAEIAEFAYIFAPVPIAGATGSPGAPLAVY